MLDFYRSQHGKESWLASLAIILDCCTVIVAGAENMSPLQAGGTFAAARPMLVEIGHSLEVRPLAQVNGHLASSELRESGRNSCGLRLQLEGRPGDRTDRQATAQHLRTDAAGLIGLPDSSTSDVVAGDECVVPTEGGKALANRLMRDTDE